MAENRDYDAEFCGKLAIHHTNSIQDFGYLLIISRETMEIIQGSENIQEISAINMEDLIGANLNAFLDVKDFTHLQKEFAKGERTRVPFRLEFNFKNGKIPVNILAHIKKDFVILEIEKEDEQSERSFTEVFQEVRSFISTIEETNNLQEICEASIQEIRRIAGFDGIRMYRFDEAWNGTVIAEEITGNLESYLGQTFPASDVPKQARALYIKNPYRLIPNRSYVSSRLYPVINPLINGFLDLSDCNLRSVAGVHLEYMANMNVSASMSIRVIVDGNLWGLISCHHITPKYLSSENRSIFEWLSLEISYRISSVIKQQSLSDAKDLLKIKAELIESIYTKGDIVAGLMQDENQNLLNLFKATGFAIVTSGGIVSSGKVPPKEELENLILWAQSKSDHHVYSTSELVEVYQEGENFSDIASGLIIIPISSHNSDFVICFRPELVQNINWGGNPNQAINFEKDGQSYHPRNSFKLWLETVTGQSEKWSAAELDVAESMRDFLFEFTTSRNYN